MPSIECNDEVYTSVGLKWRNATMSAAEYELFGDRLKHLGSREFVNSLGRVVSRLGPKVSPRALIPATTLHNLGRASPSYPFKGRDGRVSYSGHEVVRAIPLHKARGMLLREELTGGLRLVLEL